MTPPPLEGDLEAREVALLEEHLNLRKLPPVAPTRRPKRFSQTLLNHANKCKRSAYLYVRHHGGMPAHQLDRGTAFHMAAARLVNLVLERHAEGVPEGSDDEQVDEHTAKLMLEEVLAEHPEFTIPLHERDELRVMMVHLAEGLAIDLRTVVALERKFVLQLGEHTVSGVLDIACIDGTRGIVRDYKTEWMPAQDEYDATFQGRLYAVLLMFGNPVTAYDCAACKGQGERPIAPTQEGDGRPVLEVEECPDCDGHGYTEQLEPPLGSRLEEVDVGELFPRHLGEDGKIGDLHLTFARIEIEAIRRDIESQCDALAHAFDTGEFQAISGSHCERCPCEPECPLPAHLRRFAGTINTDERAKEAAEWHFFWEARLGATRKELKLYARGREAEIRFGTDQVWRFEDVQRSVPIDWEALEAANRQAAATGHSVDVAQLRVRRPGSEFKRRTLSERELAEERA